MTWKEFKKYVDKELRKRRVNEDVRIEYIDWTHGYEINRKDIDIHISDDKMSIS